jgi:hypothetical protein
MPETDLLGHPDLRKVWNVIESNAPTVEWTDITSPVGQPVTTRRIRPARKAVALLAVVALVLFAGNETVGVFAARRALAAGPAVAEPPIQLQIETIHNSKPWPAEALRDLSVNDNGIFAHTATPDDASEQWQLTDAGWTSLGVDASLVTAGETVDGIRYVAGRLHAGEAEDTAVILRLDPESEDWETVFTVTGGNIAALINVGGQLVAFGHEEDYETLRAWKSVDGTSWTSAEVEQSDSAYVGSGTSDGKVGVAVGYQDGSLPLIERRDASIWLDDSKGSTSAAALPDLGSLGFGYSIGGFRIPDGLEDVVHGEQGFVAYTGYLQVWGGFEGLTLQPREAWASLVLRSNDGNQWTAHVLTDFAIYQMVPFGDGLLAAAALPPDSDTQTIEVDGVTTEAASAVANKLYYSDDGLTWRELTNSPELGKPLLATTDGGDVLAIDEYSAEDKTMNTTTAYVILSGE